MTKEYTYYVNSEDLKEIKEGGYVEVNLEHEADPHRHRKIKVVIEGEKSGIIQSPALASYLELVKKYEKDTQSSKELLNDLETVKKQLLQELN